MIYLDHAATTPLAPEVLAAMLPWMTERFGNAASPHHLGRRAAGAVEQAQSQVAEALGCPMSAVVFTSGATEAINAIVKGIALEFGGGHFAIGATEHKAVLESAYFAAAHLGSKVDLIPSNSNGEIDLQALDDALHSQAISLVAVMDTNNETGVVNPSAEVVRLACEGDARTSIDLTQSLGKRRVNIRELGASYGVASAHKIGGPMGVGCAIAMGPPLIPFIHGGGQEQRRAPGTTNVPGVVGFGAAAELATLRLEERQARAKLLRHTFLTELRTYIPELVVNGATASVRVDDIVNVRLPGVDGDVVLARALEVALATGSACNSDLPEPSHVLTAMGLSVEQARESVRFSLGWDTTANEVVLAAQIIGRAWDEAREMS